MSINLLNNTEIIISGSITNSILTFSFELSNYDNSNPDDTYAAFINDIEISYNDIKESESDNLVTNLKYNTSYEIDISDQINQSIKLDIVHTNESINIQGYENFDGIYEYITNGYYINIDNYYTFQKKVINNSAYWIIYDNNELPSYISSTSLNSTHPHSIKLNKVSLDKIISKVNIEGGQLKIEYSTSYDEYIKNN